MSEKRFKVLDMVADARERLNIFLEHRDHMIDTNAIQQYVEWSDGAVTDTERELDSLLPLAEVAEAVATLEAARPAHTAGRVDGHAEALTGLAERVEKLEERQEKSVQTLALQGEARHALYERVVQLEASNIKRGQEIVDQAERIAALQADNASLRADLDAANRRWDAWAQIVQPDMLKVSQLDTERRLSEVEAETKSTQQVVSSHTDELVRVQDRVSTLMVQVYDDVKQTGRLLDEIGLQQRRLAEVERRQEGQG